ncbi:MAG: hypothetical protein II992_07210 [Lachnospiraceae bacterium]|nr:hypothetical protein [Lachnospiraceae bacterium]
MVNEYWKKFEKTGCIDDYLDYIQRKSDWNIMDKEGNCENELGNSDGTSTVGNAHWGI